MKKQTIFLFWACMIIALFACDKNEQKEPVLSAEHWLGRVNLKNDKGLLHTVYLGESAAAQPSFLINPGYYGDYSIADFYELEWETSFFKGVSVTPQSGSKLHFEQPQTVKVFAENGSDTLYTIRVGYIEGEWYQDGQVTTKMQLNTTSIWGFKEDMTAQTIQCWAGASGSQDALGITIPQAALPDVIGQPVDFTDFLVTLNDGQTSRQFSAGSGHFTITHFDRAAGLMSGSWDFTGFNTAGLPFNQSKGRFYNFPLIR